MGKKTKQFRVFITKYSHDLGFICIFYSDNQIDNESYDIIIYIYNLIIRI